MVKPESSPPERESKDATGNSQPENNWRIRRQRDRQSSTNTLSKARREIKTPALTNTGVFVCVLTADAAKLPSMSERVSLII